MTSEYFEKDAFAKLCNMRLISIGDGSAVVEMDIIPELLNGAGTVHGGAIFALADEAFAAASNSREGLAMAINASISYFKPALEGTLKAVAREVSLGKRLASYAIDVTDRNGILIAAFNGMVFRKT